MSPYQQRHQHLTPDTLAPGQVSATIAWQSTTFAVVALALVLGWLGGVGRRN